MKTIISHFFNEEYLLPWWLEHHKKYFDKGLMIDYGSTDNSVSIIKEICPSWDIVRTKNAYFYAPDVEPEIVEYEKQITGWRVVLNTTEFLLGNFSVLEELNHEKLILLGSHVMVDSQEQEYTQIKNSLLKERQYGIHMNNGHIRYWRSIQNYLIDYPSITGPGRHWGGDWTKKSMNIDVEYSLKNQSKDLFILWYGYSPFNDQNIKRKLQIQTRQHPNGTWHGDHNIDKNELIRRFKYHQLKSVDLSEIINKYL